MIMRRAALAILALCFLAPASASAARPASDAEAEAMRQAADAHAWGEGMTPNAVAISNARISDDGTFAAASIVTTYDGAGAVAEEFLFDNALRTDGWSTSYTLPSPVQCDDTYDLTPRPPTDLALIPADCPPDPRKLTPAHVRALVTRRASANRVVTSINKKFDACSDRDPNMTPAWSTCMAPMVNGPYRTTTRALLAAVTRAATTTTPGPCRSALARYATQIRIHVRSVNGVLAAVRRQHGRLYDANNAALKNTGPRLRKGWEDIAAECPRR